MNLASDSQRRLENVIRYGVVEDVDYKKALARVKTGEILTDWLPWAAARAGTTTTWSPLTKGEQVAVLSPSGELHTGVILPSLYTTLAPAPSQDPNAHVVKFADDAVVEYNQQSHALRITGVATVYIEASESITFDTPTVHCTNNLHIANISTADVDHLSNGVSGHDHTHTQNAGNHYGGGATTTPPN